MGRDVVIFAVLGGVLLVLATLATPERIPEGAGVVRLLLVSFGAVLLLLGLLFWGLNTGVRLVAEERENLMARGLPATARVLRVEPRSGGNDSYLRVAVTLEVTVPGRQTYVTTHECSVDMVFAGRLRPGEWLSVLVAPEDSQELLVRWEEAATPPVGAVR